MNGVNSIFFQPISIHMPYMQSILADILLKSKLVNVNLETYTEFDYSYNLNDQYYQREESGADTFPIIMDIKGPIIKYSNWYCVGTQFLTEIVKQLDANPKVSHIILNIDSGGGMVSGTTELSETIRNCKTTTISFTSGLACSAAQQIFSAADYNIAAPYADLLGSIGTLISYQDFSAMYEKYGAKIYEAYAPQSTEKNKAFRDWKEGDAKAIEEELKVHTENFISTMKTYRGDKLQDDGKIFKGKTYRPQEAKAVGLVDEIMTMDELLNQL